MTDLQTIEKMIQEARDIVAKKINNTPDLASTYSRLGINGMLAFDKLCAEEASLAIVNHYSVVIAEKDKEIYQRDLAIKLGDEKSAKEIEQLKASLAYFKRSLIEINRIVSETAENEAKLTEQLAEKDKEIDRITAICKHQGKWNQDTGVLWHNIFTDEMMKKDANIASLKNDNDLLRTAALQKDEQIRELNKQLAAT